MSAHPSQIPAPFQWKQGCREGEGGVPVEVPKSNRPASMSVYGYGWCRSGIWKPQNRSYQNARGEKPLGTKMCFKGACNHCALLCISMAKQARGKGSISLPYQLRTLRFCTLVELPCPHNRVKNSNTIQRLDFSIFCSIFRGPYFRPFNQAS